MRHSAGGRVRVALPWLLPSRRGTNTGTAIIFWAEGNQVVVDDQGTQVGEAASEGRPQQAERSLAARLGVRRAGPGGDRQPTGAVVKGGRGRGRVGDDL